MSSTGDKHVDAVIESHRKRVQLGKAKYGMTLDTNPAGIVERLRHIQEEAMDAAAYCEWAMAAYRRELNKRAMIEQVMLDAAGGKRPMPDACQLRRWALALGTPQDQWPHVIRESLK